MCFCTPWKVIFIKIFQFLSFRVTKDKVESWELSLPPCIIWEQISIFLTDKFEMPIFMKVPAICNFVFLHPLKGHFCDSIAIFYASTLEWAGSHELYFMDSIMCILAVVTSLVRFFSLSDHMVGHKMFFVFFTPQNYVF